MSTTYVQRLPCSTWRPCEELLSYQTVVDFPGLPRGRLGDRFRRLRGDSRAFYSCRLLVGGGGGGGGGGGSRGPRCVRCTAAMSPRAVIDVELPPLSGTHITWNCCFPAEGMIWVRASHRPSLRDTVRIAEARARLNRLACELRQKRQQGCCDHEHDVLLRVVCETARHLKEQVRRVYVAARVRQIQEEGGRSVVWLHRELLERIVELIADDEMRTSFLNHDAGAAACLASVEIKPGSTI